MPVLNPMVTQIPPRSDYPRWETWRPFFNPTVYKFLGDVSNDLRKVNAILDKAVNVLETVKSFVMLLAELEALIKQGILGFIQLIADKLDRIVTDFESTGIYFLDLTSYHFTDEVEISKTDEYGDELSARKPWWDSRKNVAGEAKEGITAKQLSKEESRIVRLGIVLSNFFASIHANYKKESYNEFITTICNAFTDPNDLPRRGLLDEFRKVKNPPTNEGVKVVDLSMLKGMRAQIPLVFQCGKPDFGPNCTMYVFILGFTVPDIYKLYLLITKIGKVFNVFYNYSTIKKIIDFFKDDNKGDKIEKFLKGLIDEFDLGFPYEEQKKSELASREQPNFIGITAYSLFGDIFDTIHRLINKLRSFTYNIDTTLLDVIIDIINAIENDVRNLQKIIQSIIDVIDFINALLALTQFFILKITTKQGTADVVDQIYNSKGFFMMSQDSLDKMDEEESDRQNTVNNELNIYAQEKVKINDEYLGYKTIYNELTSLKGIVQQWVDYTESSNPPLKRPLSEIEQDIEDKQLEYSQNSETINSDIDLQKSDINSLASFKKKRDDKTTERNTYSSGMNIQISIKQEELNTLIKQYNDSQDPLLTVAVPDNYESRRAALELEISTLTGTRDSSISNYNNLITRLSSLISFIEGTIPSYYESARTTAINTLNAYKAALILLTNQYDLDKQNKENEISSKESDLATNRTNQISQRLLINSIQNEINLWLATNGPPVPQALQDSLDAANLQLNNLITEESSLINQINDLRIELAAIENNYLVNKNQNIKNQEMEQWKIDCFTIEIVVRNLNDSLNILTNNYNSQISSLMSEKSSIYATGAGILANQNLFPTALNVLAKVTPYFIDNEELNPDEKKKFSSGNYDINDPDITRIENIIKIYDDKGYLNSVEARISVIDGQINKVIDDNKKKHQEYVERKTMLQGLVDKFDPDEPGYFGGFLICMGYPNVTNENYFNFGELTNQYWNSPNCSPLIGSKMQEWGSKKDSLLKLF